MILVFEAQGQIVRLRLSEYRVEWASIKTNDVFIDMEHLNKYIGDDPASYLERYREFIKTYCSYKTSEEKINYIIREMAKLGLIYKKSV